MERLWAPWRARYVRGQEKDDSDPQRPAASAPSCFICRAWQADGQEDRQNLLVRRGRHTAVLLNRYPYNNGHLLVAPSAHLGDLLDLDSAALTDTMSWIQASLTALRELMSPDGFNVGLNLGSAAGAGLPGHLHWHIVPRWDGDANFMPVLAETKVIVESLDQLYDRLRPRLVDPQSRPIADETP